MLPMPAGTGLQRQSRAVDSGCKSGAGLGRMSLHPCAVCPPDQPQSAVPSAETEKGVTRLHLRQGSGPEQAAS